LIIFGQPAALSQTTDREYFNRGVDHFNKKLYDQANSDYTRAKELARDLDDDQAMDAVAAGPGVRGRVSENEYFIKGVNALVEGRSDEAIANLNKAIELNPGRADAYHNRVKADELITRRRAKQPFVISG